MGGRSAAGTGVKAELVDFPTGEKDFYPVQPKLRITNNSGVTLAQGAEISLDLPTSMPPVVKDNDYKEMKGLVPGHTGPNTGGLKGDFRRLTLTLGYCEDLAPGKSRDIDLKYYLPITGPSNVTFRIGGREYGSTGDQRRDVRTVTPPAPTAGSSCQAPDWKQGQVYRPDGGRLWRMYDKGDKGWMFEYGDSPAGKPMMIDNNPDQSRAHLVELTEQNPNQYWQIQSAGGGLYTIAGGGRCLTATASRQDIASLGCDGRNEQKWQLVPIADNGSEGTPGGPKHNGLFKLRSTAGNDIEVGGGATARETHLLTGDPAASTAAFVKYQGSYWYAQWYTAAAPGTAEANGGRPWKKAEPDAVTVKISWPDTARAAMSGQLVLLIGWPREGGVAGSAPPLCHRRRVRPGLQQTSTHRHRPKWGSIARTNRTITPSAGSDAPASVAASARFSEPSCRVKRRPGRRGAGGGAGAGAGAGDREIQAVSQPSMSHRHVQHAAARDGADQGPVPFQAGIESRRP